jgi:hypothetical protein
MGWMPYSTNAPVLHAETQTVAPQGFALEQAIGFLNFQSAAAGRMPYAKKRVKTVWRNGRLAVFYGMARSWSGFVPQNHHVLEQWGVMEATSQEIVEVLLALPKESERESKDKDALNVLAGWPYDTE